MEDNSSSLHDLITSSCEKKYIGSENGLVELLWRDGHVVFHNQSSGRSPPNIFEPEQAQKTESLPEGGECPDNSSSFIQEDETASWLQYPLDNSLGKEFSEFLYEPPMSQPIVIDKSSNRVEKRVKFNPNVDSNSCGKQDNLHPQTYVMPPPNPTSNGGAVVDLGETSSIKATISSVCGSNHVQNQAEISHSLSNMKTAKNTLRKSSRGPLQEKAHKHVISSSSVASGCSFGNTGCISTSNHAQKRKHGDVDESDAHSEDTGYESAEANKPVQRPASGRRSRAAEVHNLSERKRRDRINEKMRALQELIPHCNKSDKASMLDEAIEYLKSLQLQLQVMWMGSGMNPMLFPSIQQYKSRLCHGIGLPVMPSMQNPFPSDNRSMHVSSIPNPSPVYSVQGSSHPNFPAQLQNFHLLDPYSGYLGFPQMHLPPQMINMCGNLQMMQQNQVAAAADKQQGCNKNSI
ncbi:hypothetical protein HPP92_018947 [Vanilla planifolia]|uniref:BHLH domain-containing protein n=1 Tax=Vanilla planifolia TaxID=51239 RepID=A0A835UKH8_VANPL|nr:hypothetical protein HPP92_018947 [Vanilla planifolia]